MLTWPVENKPSQNYTLGLSFTEEFLFDFFFAVSLLFKKNLFCIDVAGSPSKVFDTVNLCFRKKACFIHLSFLTVSDTIEGKYHWKKDLKPGDRPNEEKFARRWSFIVSWFFKKKRVFFCWRFLAPLVKHFLFQILTCEIFKTISVRKESLLNAIKKKIYISSY